MHIDAMLGTELRAAAAGARALEEQGFEAAWCGETAARSVPAARAGPRAQRIHLGAGVIAFARNPQTLATSARLLTERVGDLVDRVTLYTPYDVRRECVLEMTAELRDLSADPPRTPASARQ